MTSARNDKEWECNRIRRGASDTFAMARLTALTRDEERAERLYARHAEEMRRCYECLGVETVERFTEADT